MNPLSEMTSMPGITFCGDCAWPIQAPEELAGALASAGRTVKVERGGRLFSYGDAAAGVFLILKGAARAALPGAAGRELVSRTAGPGAVLGLPSALCATRHQFDVAALEAVEAVYLETGTVNEILRLHPALCMQIMNMMCEELSTLRQTREQMQGCEKQTCALHASCIGATGTQ